MSAAEAIYLLGAATSILAAVLLLRQYWRRRTSLLFWSSVAFLCLAINSVLVYLDLSVFPNVDLSLPRGVAAVAAMVALVYGLVREAV